MERKLSLFLITVIFLTSILAGCNSTKASEEVNNLEEGSGDEVDTSEEGIKITDMAGREVILEKPAEKVVAIGSALRIYTYINGTEKLVGVEKKQQDSESGRPYIMANTELAELPIVGEGFPAEPDPELIIGADPDIIIAGDILDISEIEELENKIDIPIVVVTTGSSAVFDEDMYKSLEIIGKVVGKENRAEEVIRFMEDCKNELMDLTKDIPEEEKPSIYIGGLSYKGAHGIESTSCNSPVLNTIGAKNAADEIGKTGSVMIDKEKLIEWDPDILVIDENGLALVKEDYEKNPEYYNSLSAVKNKKVYGQLPYVSYYNNIETAMADIYFLGKILYPDEFKYIDPVEKADEIYEFILGVKLYDQMAEKFGGYVKIDLEKDFQ